MAEITNHRIGVLDLQDESLETDELVDIGGNHSMSHQLDDYGDQKGKLYKLDDYEKFE